jgi:hypothetical protein
VGTDLVFVDFHSLVTTSLTPWSRGAHVAPPPKGQADATSHEVEELRHVLGTAAVC